MILKGSQRGGARQLARHLLNDRDNDHVQVHRQKGFIADDLEGALVEAHAIAKGTRCRQFLFSLSLNPPKSETVTEDQFEDAIEAAEQRLGLVGQPRAVVYHEKHGRRHAHVVWSRIDIKAMRAINLPFFKQRLTELSRELYLQHGWTLPDGLRRDGGKSPLNFTLGEWQKAKCLKLDPREIKQSFIAAWEQSDNLASFRAALAERRYFLARGDQRGFVAVDIHGEVYAVARWTGIKTKEVRAKLGTPDSLPSVAEVHSDISTRISDKVRGYAAVLSQRHTTEMAPLAAQLDAMRTTHRAERELLRQRQENRWRSENILRMAQFRRGILGLWDRATGRWQDTRRRNEAQVILCWARDQRQRDQLVASQLAERRALELLVEQLSCRQAVQRRQLEGDATSSIVKDPVGSDRLAMNAPIRPVIH